MLAVAANRRDWRRDDSCSAALRCIGEASRNQGAADPTTARDCKSEAGAAKLRQPSDSRPINGLLGQRKRPFAAAKLMRTSGERLIRDLDPRC